MGSDKKGKKWSWSDGAVDGGAKQGGANIKGYKDGSTGYIVRDSDDKTHHYVENKKGKVVHHDEK